MDILEKALTSIEKYFEETPSKEILKEVNEIDSLPGDGVSFFDYLDTLNDSYEDIFTNSVYWETGEITGWAHISEISVKCKIPVLPKEINIMRLTNKEFHTPNLSDLITCNSANLKLAA